MIGGAYLCFEGAEKVLHSLQKNKTTLAEDVAVVADQDHEEAMVKGAVRTDFILSAEILVIALNAVLDEHLAMRAATLAAVAIAHTHDFYGLAGLISRVADYDLPMAQGGHCARHAIASALVDLPT